MAEPLRLKEKYKTQVAPQLKTKFGYKNVHQIPKLEKVVRQSRRFKAHDELNAAAIGDLVRIQECRPYSKEKRWRLLEIVERAK